MLSIYKPAPHCEPFPSNEVPREYARYRLQVMITIFTGYAVYYFVRQNFSLAKPYLIKELGLTTGDVGLIASALTIAYGISKFVMGNVSDRSNARYFMATGLILSGIVNLIFGFLPSVTLMMVFWFMNGWFQGMGWPPCGRIMTHWFSDRERGTKMAIWNLAHNVGAGTIGPIVSLVVLCLITWKSIFYVPAIIAIIAGILIIIFLRDTPQSVGLPPIEEYMNDYPHTGVEDRERELTASEILFKFVLNNKFLWILALANVFVYVVRYGVVNWAPTYLTTIKDCPPDLARWQFFIFEYAGIPGMLLSGWASDKIFHGRRAPMSVLFMFIVTGAVVLYWLNPVGRFWVDSLALSVIGFLIYGPVMLIGIAAVDIVPKKAAGTAAGFTGLFGYLGATVAEVGIGKVVQYYNWDGGFIVLIASALLATFLLSLTWNVHDRKTE
ncbi:MAG TPA: phosphoglycerate transporter protein PgtP [Candidatus Eremiobacteraeota bacterium]|nr:phosphoglycerate transporter protein PgtP [Candidatus Eremiobacteraeota bacterium]